MQGDTDDERGEKTHRTVRWLRDLQQQKATATSRSEGQRIKVMLLAPSGWGHLEDTGTPHKPV